MRYLKPDLFFLGNDRRAVTALEYGIVAAFLCVVLLTIFRGFGSTLTAMFSNATSSL